MGVRTPQADYWPPERPPALEPSWLTAGTLAVVIFALLISNGRPIASGHTRAAEQVAARLVLERGVDTDKPAEARSPVTAESPSIETIVSAVAAAPVFVLCRTVFDLDETGRAVAGKLAASLFSALAAMVLFVAVARRRTQNEAVVTALLFALGTSVWSTSQGLHPHPLAVAGLAVALLFLSRAEDDPVWAGRAGLPLGCVLIARPADVGIVAALAVAALVRFPRQSLRLGLWGAPVPVVVAAFYAVRFGVPWANVLGEAGTRISAPGGGGHMGLLISPAKGLLVFTPVVIVGLIGLVRAWRGGSRFLAAACGAAVLAHWLLTGFSSVWDGGEGWGCRLMTDALPALLLFLPEGMDATRAIGVVLAVLSCAAQVIGAFAYDTRWEQLYQRSPMEAPPYLLWRIEHSPLAFHLRERVAILAAPGLDGSRVFIRRYPVVISGPTGSRLRFSEQGLSVDGSPVTFGDAHLQAAARTLGDVVELRKDRGCVFLRVVPGARRAPLVLQISGEGKGTIAIGETSFWVRQTRWRTYEVSGAFHIRHPYSYPESGGSDLVITVTGRPGEADIREITLAPPSAPAPRR